MIIAVGIYRSASTWVANVAAELLRMQGPARIVYADNAATLAAGAWRGGDGRLVVKSHTPAASLRLLIRAAQPPVIVSVRDPADCVASLMERFDEPFRNAAFGVARSCRAVLAVTGSETPLIVHYEAPLAREAAGVAAIAAHLGVPVCPMQAQALADRFQPAEVKRLIDGLDAEGAFGDGADPRRVHAGSRWHREHLGTGEAGRGGGGVLSSRQLEELATMTELFRARFGYPPALR